MNAVSAIQRPQPPASGTPRMEQQGSDENEDRNLDGEVSERNGNDEAWWLSGPSSFPSSTSPSFRFHSLDTPTSSHAHHHPAPASPSSPYLLHSRSRSRSPTRSLHSHPPTHRGHRPYSSPYHTLQSRTEELEQLLLTQQEASEEAERLWIGRVKKLLREGEVLKKDLERSEEARRELKEKSGLSRREGKRREGPVIQWDESSFIDAEAPNPDHQVGELSRSSHLLSQPSPSILRSSSSTSGPAPSSYFLPLPPIVSSHDSEESTISPFPSSSSTPFSSVARPRSTRPALPKSVSFSNSTPTPASTIRGRTLGSELGDDEWWAYQEAGDDSGLQEKGSGVGNGLANGKQKREGTADGEEVLNEVESLLSGGDGVRGHTSYQGGLRDVEVRRVKSKTKERPRLVTRLSLVGMERKSIRPTRPLNTPIENGNSLVGTEVRSNVRDVMVAGIAVVSSSFE